MLRCDIEKLRGDKLSMEQPSAWAGIVTRFGLGGDSTSVDTTDLRSLLDQLSTLAQTGKTFDVVVVLAHGNDRGVRIAAGHFAHWEALAAYLKPFKPRRLVLVACKSGRYDGVNALFGRLPSLRRIFASPLNVGRDPASVLLVLAPYLVANAAPPDQLVRGAQLLMLSVTRCPVWQWMRTRDLNNPHGRAFDALGDWLRQAMS